MYSRSNCARAAFKRRSPGDRRAAVQVQLRHDVVERDGARGLRAVDDVLEQLPQLDDVAVPGQGGEQRQRRPRQGSGRELLERADAPQQISCDGRDVLPALAQGRQVDADDRQHANQIVAHTALVRAAVEPGLDAGDRPHVEADGCPSPTTSPSAAPARDELAAAEAVRRRSAGKAFRLPPGAAGDRRVFGGCVKRRRAR